MMHTFGKHVHCGGVHLPVVRMINLSLIVAGGVAARL
jgi:hypothetical protein